MKVVIIEDEIPAARRLKKLIMEVIPQVEIITVLESVRQSIDWFTNNESPDLIFSDIRLSDDLSFEIFKNISIEAPIIFTTAYDEYAIQAFEHLSVDYLLKPIRREHLEKALKKLEKIRKKDIDIPTEALLEALKGNPFKSRFLVYAGENLISLPIENIAYFYSEDGITFIKTKEGKRYIFNDSLDKIESQCDPKDFFRANRQYLLSIESVKNVIPYFNQKLKVSLIPETEGDVIVSKLKTTEFKGWLNK